MRVACLLFVFAVVAAAADLEWQHGTVLSSSVTMERADPVAGGNIVQIAYCQMQVKGGGYVYDVEERVAPKRAVRFAPGTEVVFAIDGKTFALRAPDGKTHKLKITAKTADK